MRTLTAVLTGAWLALVPLACTEERDVPPRVVPQFGPQQPRRVAFSPRGAGRLAVVEADGALGVWDVSRPARPICQALLRAGARDARFTPDGRDLVSVGYDGAVRIWEDGARLARRSTQRHDGAAGALAVGSDLIVSGGDEGAIRFWRLDGSPRGDPVHAHQGGVLSLALSSRGPLLSFGVDQTVRLWRSRSGDGAYDETAAFPLASRRVTAMLPTLLKLDTNWGWGRAVAFDPQGDVFAAAVFDGTVRFWSAEGTPLGPPIAGHGKTHVQSVAFSPSGERLAAAYHDGVIGFLRSDGTPAGKPLVSHQGPVYSVDFGPGNALAAAGGDEAVRLWGPGDALAGTLPAARARRIRALAVSPRGDVLATGDERGAIRIWNIDGSARTGPIRAHTSAVGALAWSADGTRLASGGADCVARLWTVEGASWSVPTPKQLGTITALAFSARGDVLATGTRYDPVRLWRVEDMAPLRELEGLRDIASALAFSPDGTVLAGTSEVIELWRVDGSWRAPRIEGPWGVVNTVAFSPLGDRLASGGGDGSVYLWKADGSPDQEPLSGHRGPVRAVAFASDGRLVSGGEDGALLMWQLPSRTPRAIDFGLPVEQLGFTVDGRLWARARGGDLQLYDREGEPIAALYFDPNGALVISADGWYAGTGQLAERVEVFRGSDRLDATGVAARRSPERVRARLGVEAARR